MKLFQALSRRAAAPAPPVGRASRPAASQRSIWGLLLIGSLGLTSFTLSLSVLRRPTVQPKPKTAATALTRGAVVYKNVCLTCHQADGKGVPNMNPPLIQTSYVLGDKTKLVSWVLKGSGDEKVPIDGKYYNNNMPPQAALKDENIASILTYIRSNFSNKASAVTSAEVKAVRASL